MNGRAIKWLVPQTVDEIYYSQEVPNSVWAYYSPIVGKWDAHYVLDEK